MCKELTGKHLQLDQNGYGKIIHSSLRMELTVPHKQPSDQYRLNSVSRRPENDADFSLSH